MIVKATNAAGPAIRNIRGLGTGERITLAPAAASLVTVPGGAQADTTVRDIVYANQSAATVQTWQHVRATISFAHPLGPQALSYASLDPSVATVDAQTGTVTPVAASGTARIQVTATCGLRAVTTVTIATTGGQAVRTFKNFATGSLGKFINDSLAALVTGKTRPTFGPLVGADNRGNGGSMTASSTLCDVYNLVPGNGDYSGSTKNATGIWANYDTSFLALRWFPNGPNAYLITPQHVGYAGHYDFPNNLPMSLMGRSGTIYPRVRVGRLAPSGVPDVEIGVLDSPLPADVVPIKFAPANWRSAYLPTSDAGSVYPLPYHTQDHRLLIAMLTAGSDPIGQTWNAWPAGDGTYAGWNYATRGGDSGSGAFIPYSASALALIGHTLSYNPSGIADCTYQTAIQAAITASGSPYTIGVADFSTFSTP